MPHNRYFIDSPLNQHSSVTLSGDEWHHLTRVLRARQGERIELINGKGQLAEATVEQLKKNEAELIVGAVISKPPLPSLILAQAIPRMNHLEWIIEKGVELNATQFWLFPGHLSEKESLSDTQLRRLELLSISAMKQCGRLDLPPIHLKAPLTRWARQEGTFLFGDTDESAPYLWDIDFSSPLSKPIVIAIGPEKGFHSKERSYLIDSLHAKPVRLHRNILRAETAPLVALSLLQPHLN
jgi:16S rRNA (uracil1498-N3)-methyltransferase